MRLLSLRWLRRALTRTEVRASGGRGKKVEKDVVPPNEALVYGVAVSIVFFVVFGSLEAVHMWLFGEWNETIFSAMAFISGSLTSAFFVNGLSR